ncbi:MAG TPA: hypothetical protein VKD66_20585, partial [Streptosporangiaceae bacterium]|nr:hypothetical protein [Streptosporangiaceae bacterium]
LASGARDTAHKVTSWLLRWMTEPSKPSAIAEQVGHPGIARPEHEVVDQQLRAPGEQVGQRRRPWSVSNR